MSLQAELDAFRSEFMANVAPELHDAIDAAEAVDGPFAQRFYFCALRHIV
jgi:hypothetical protein